MKSADRDPDGPCVGDHERPTDSAGRPRRRSRRRTRRRTHAGAHAGPDPDPTFSGTTIYVSTSGLDSNVGTENNPVRTIQRGIALAT